MARRRVRIKGSLVGDVWKCVFVLTFGIVVLEVLLEAGFSSSMFGSSKLLSMETASGGGSGTKLKAVDTPLKQNMRVVANTSLYDGPYLKSQKVAMLKAGATLITVAKTTVGNDVWYQTLRFGGKIGYVHGSDVRRQ